MEQKLFVIEDVYGKERWKEKDGSVAKSHQNDEQSRYHFNITVVIQYLLIVYINDERETASHQMPCVCACGRACTCVCEREL